MGNKPKKLLALEIVTEKCKGTLACMRVCPTQAIRVRKGKVSIHPQECIFCGTCIRACPEGAIRPRTDAWESIHAFPFKVAIPSTSLFGQFPASIPPADIFDGLLALGFDAVYDLSIESELVRRAIQDYLDEYEGPLPLISSTCPVVVRLIQYFYPHMIGQIVPIESPRELAAREVKRYYAEEKGIPPEDIGAIYITPCSAKMAAIKHPAEGADSHLDLAIGIREIYNPLLAAITKLQSQEGERRELGDRPSVIRSKLSLNMTLTGGVSHNIRQNRYITISQLPNIIRVIEDIEKGKIRDVEFLECYSCTGGCIGGPLNVDNLFVARSKIEKLVREVEAANHSVEQEVERRYVKGDYFIRRPIEPRPDRKATLDLREQIAQIKMKERLAEILPGIDCGLCGCPTCEVFAEDVSTGKAEAGDCILVDAERIRDLRALYAFDEKRVPRKGKDDAEKE
ncbi:MAG: 4Fe-4S binding protein [Candidatus Eisenbacteria bacterium]|nr:4Fe-4S binding protein [Candidatus Eisenbacteria bacterium]